MPSRRGYNPQVYSLSNGSHVAVSKLNVGFTEYDDGAVFRCVATSSIVAAQEPKPQDQISVSVQCEFSEKMLILQNRNEPCREFGCGKNPPPASPSKICVLFVVIQI